MLEIPESYSISKQLNEAVAGKTIRKAIANASPHGFAWYFGDPASYNVLLVNETINKVIAVAGQVEFHAGVKRILLGDGVNIRYIPPGGAIPKKHQLYLEFTDNSALTCTVQMYGGIWAFVDGENDNPYYKVALEAPSPLSDAFDEEYFNTLFDATKKSLSVKAFLATEQRIPGLGNGVLQDILFNARLNPKTKLETLDEKQVHSLFLSLKNTIKNMADLGGRDIEKDLYGKPGGYKTILSKKTLADPCPVCYGAIVRQAYLGGNVYFCPTCQPLPEKR